MRLQYISNACVMIEHQNTRVLCDPWLVDGAFDSWFHYPPLNYVPEDFAHVDYIYLSHIHPDHMDVKTLSRLPKTIKILILEFEEKYLLKRLQSLGFKNIIELPHKGKISLNDDFTIELLSADNCNPELCGKTFGCRVPQLYTKTLQIDSLAVFNGAGKTIVNTNDCPYELAFSVCDYIKDSYETIDFLLVGYNSAGPYPQCFDNYDNNEKLEKANQIKRKCLDRAIGYLKDLSPDFFLPFAGQYVLGGKNSILNSYKATTEVEDLPFVFGEIVKKHKFESQLVMLNSGGWFDLDTQIADEFTPPNPTERQRYIEETLSKIKYPYENVENYQVEIDDNELLEMLNQAQAKMFNKMDQLYGGIRLEWNLYIDVGKESLYCVPFDGKEVSIVAPEDTKEPYIKITLDLNLFVMILQKKAHWNNADIGAHLRYFRKPDRFDFSFIQFLSYLHC